MSLLLLAAVLFWKIDNSQFRKASGTRRTNRDLPPTFCEPGGADFSVAVDSSWVRIIPMITIEIGTIVALQRKVN